MAEGQAGAKLGGKLGGKLGAWSLRSVSAAFLITPPSWHLAPGISYRPLCHSIAFRCCTNPGTSSAMHTPPLPSSPHYLVHLRIASSR